MSNYWRKVIAVLRRVSVEGTVEEQMATEKIISMIEQMQQSEEPETPLSGAWSEIQDRLADLSLEPYIDDQYEITEIWEIVDDLLKKGSLENEPWSLKEEILTAMFENDWFDEYGIMDPMQDLENAMCITPEEQKAKAELRRKIRRR